MKKMLGSLLLVLLVFEMSLYRNSSAQEPLLSVRLGFDHTRYLLNPALAPDGDPITAVVTIENISGRDLLATKGFADNLHLSLRFVDPQGRQLTAQHLHAGLSGPNLPAFIVDDSFVVGNPVELVDSTFQISATFNARDFYAFQLAGRHTARSFVSVGLYETASAIPGTSTFARFEEKISGETLISNAVTITLIDDADGDGWCFPTQHPVLCPTNPQPDCEDRPAGADGVLGTADDGANLNPGRAEIPNNGLDDDCNPATPDVQIVDAGTFKVTLRKRTVGLGHPPGSTEEPVANQRIRVFDKSINACATTRFGVSPRYYEAIWRSCPNVLQGNAFTRGPDGAADEPGTATLRVSPGNYLIIAQFDADGSTTDDVSPHLSGDEIYVGASAGALQTGQTKELTLPVIVREDGSLVPAKPPNKDKKK